MSNRTLKISVVWLILGTGLFFFLRSINVPRLDVLAYRGVETKGKVLELFPNNHQTLNYSFMVNGKEFKNLGNSGFGNPSFNSLRVGEALIVFYDPQRPDVSILGYPKLRKENEMMTAIIGAILFPSFITFILARKKVL